jgi:hypothetical protein
VGLVPTPVPCVVVGWLGSDVDPPGYWPAPVSCVGVVSCCGVVGGEEKGGSVVGDIVWCGAGGGFWVVGVGWGTGGAGCEE